jgi:hypothetical protein
VQCNRAASRFIVLGHVGLLQPVEALLSRLGGERTQLTTLEYTVDVVNSMSRRDEKGVNPL